MPCLGESYSGWLPVIVEGDGNCLPRSASVACFGTKTAHEEIRTRIGIEMALHKEQYINNDYINRGIDLPRKGFTMYFSNLLARMESTFFSATETRE
jgi:hypothetical protein